MAMAGAQDIIAIKNKLIQTMLDIAADMPWNDITLYDIVAKAGIELDEIKVLFPCKSDIINAYARQVDHRLIDEMDGAFGEGESARDKLFDIIMERFDILNEHRDAIISVINGVTLDPKQGMESLSPLCSSIITIMNIANIEVDGWRGAIKISALSALYLKSLRDWVGDTSPDMAATMAGLDKSLGYFEKIKF